MRPIFSSGSSVWTTHATSPLVETEWKRVCESMRSAHSGYTAMRARLTPPSSSSTEITSPRVYRPDAAERRSLLPAAIRDVENQLAPMEGELSADAVMPAHGHGMSYAVETTRTVDGAAKLEGFLWQMPGAWQLRFRLKTPDGNYRATYDYEFAPR